MPEKLQWSLMVITYNRMQFLRVCLQHALTQTRQPSEVVIVDASQDWRSNLEKVELEFAEYWSSIKLVYEPAQTKGITFQRNQALDLASSEIVFSLDDDIYLWKDAAAVIMRAYEMDKDRLIAGVGGHFVDYVPAPGEEIVEYDATESTDSTPRSPFLAKLKNKLETYLSLESHFVGYEGGIRYPELPNFLEGEGLFAGGLINGGRTTFRRCYGLKTRWSSLLRLYATHEDSDFSYRLSRQGLIIQAPRARFFHADGAEDRPDKFKINTIRVRNLLSLHRENSQSRLLSYIRVSASLLFFTGLYCLIDPARGRWRFPNALSYAYGVLQAPIFLLLPIKDFPEWYAELQDKMYRS